ncbi:transposase, partial [Stecheria sp. CLA-KB-P133]|nr:transposase [Stecheria sp. CLA-KB-P133]
MKLYYDKRLKDPTYYAQMGFRTTDGKSTTKNVKKLGKHSELLKITDDPVAYCKQLIARMNEDSRQGKESVQISVDLNEKVDQTS